jgi:RNA polymerase sigma-70 factor, ECF subfamily
MREAVARLEDKTLIEMTVAGHIECFSVLMDRHETAVRRCIGAMIRNRSDVEDLFQDTFLKAWRGLPKFRFEANFRTWIISVAANEALGSYRRRRSRPSCFPATNLNLESFRSSCESPDEALARSEARRTVRSAISRLPEKYREILILCDLEELSAREAAQRLKSTIPSVKTRLFRARHMLSKALNGDAA